MTSVRPDRRHLFLLLLPLALIGIFLIGERLTEQRDRQEDATAARAARALVGEELGRVRRDLERTNAHEAYRSAQNYVRADLLPPTSSGTATFPALPPTGDDPVNDITISRLPRPHGYRVRGHVTWTDSTGRLQRRRFESDLQLGPADDRWHLIDTEFLP